MRRAGLGKLWSHWKFAGTGLPDSLSLCTVCILEFEQNPELSVALWRSPLTPPGMDV